MGEFVTVERSEEAIATIRLNRPPVNALNASVAREISDAIEEVRTDDGIRVVIAWGGEKVFAAGADIKEMSERDPIATFRYIGDFQGVFTRLEQLPKVTIAAINGYALGGGCELSLACDFRICADDAQLGQPEILLGVIPGAGGTQRLPRIVGIAHAKDIIYSGRFVKSDEALAIGLVNKVVPAGEVYDSALKWAKRYAGGPTVALMAAKQAIQTGIEVDLATGLVIERQAFAALFASEDQKIGMQSFIEEGPGKAQFVGR